MVRNIDKFAFLDEGGGGIVAARIPVYVNNETATLVLRMKKRELAKLVTLLINQTQLRQDEFRTDTHIAYTP